MGGNRVSPQINTLLVEGGSVIGTSIVAVAAMVAVVVTSMMVVRGAAGGVGGGEVLVERCPEGEVKLPMT
jgi:hypothetical protein